MFTEDGGAASQSRIPRTSTHLVEEVGDEVLERVIVCRTRPHSNVSVSAGRTRSSTTAPASAAAAACGNAAAASCSGGTSCTAGLPGGRRLARVRVLLGRGTGGGSGGGGGVEVAANAAAVALPGGRRGKGHDGGEGRTMRG